MVSACSGQPLSFTPQPCHTAILGPFHRGDTKAQRGSTRSLCAPEAGSGLLPGYRQTC